LISVLAIPRTIGTREYPIITAGMWRYGPRMWTYSPGIS
jgi:hypothetical protein